MLIYTVVAFGLWCLRTKVFSLDCEEILTDEDIKHVAWEHLERCLAENGGQPYEKNISENIWRLSKNAFNGVENLPADSFLKLGYSLTAITPDELSNISMEVVETVEAFGSVRKTHVLEGFDSAQTELIVAKVLSEWLGKSPKVYSEYDLMSLGELLCHFNVSDIADIQPIAFREAAQRIGTIYNCPEPQLRALAKLAVHDDAFGVPSRWSELDVIQLGNILNGLPSAQIASIDKKKLHLNKYYQKKTNEGNKKS